MKRFYISIYMKSLLPCYSSAFILLVSYIVSQICICALAAHILWTAIISIYYSCTTLFEMTVVTTIRPGLPSYDEAPIRQSRKFETSLKVYSDDKPSVRNETINSSSYSLTTLPYVVLVGVRFVTTIHHGVEDPRMQASFSPSRDIIFSSWRG